MMILLVGSSVLASASVHFLGNIRQQMRGCSFLNWENVMLPLQLFALSVLFCTHLLCVLHYSTNEMHLFDTSWNIMVHTLNINLDRKQVRDVDIYYLNNYSKETLLVMYVYRYELISEIVRLLIDNISNYISNYIALTMISRFYYSSLLLSMIFHYFILSLESHWFQRSAYTLVTINEIHSFCYFILSIDTL